MADLLVDLATYLDANSALTAGVDLFVGDLPPTPDAATVLYEPGGFPPAETMGADSQPAVIRPRVQVVTRAGGAQPYLDARVRAHDVYRLFVVIANETVNGAYYARVVPVQDPFLLARDESERVSFACNYDVFREPEA